MRRLRPGALAPKTQRTLAALQQTVDAEPTYEAQVATCKKEWGRKTSSKGKKAAFQDVKAKLSAMSAGQRCHYCEDSYADEIEHFAPKDLYPDLAFRWDNYAYACGPCNGPKNNKFAIIDASGALVDVTRARSASVTPPPRGQTALIDPRQEDPLEFFVLDLDGTFEFVALDDPDDPTSRLRATYTIDVLRLNARPVLVRQRKKSFLSFAAMLFQYSYMRGLGHSPADLRELRDNILTSPHQSVWISMQRAARQQRGPARIRQMFAIAPEALTW